MMILNSLSSPSSCGVVLFNLSSSTKPLNHCINSISLNGRIARRKCSCEALGGEDSGSGSPNSLDQIVYPGVYGPWSVDQSDVQEAEPRSVSDAHRQRSGLESLFCYDKPVPEEIIEKPIGLSMSEKEIGDKQRCTKCQAKGAVLCATCVGSGLYVDSIMESQGIIVKVRCLGCGGSGNIMCADCGGRGHPAH